MNFQRKACRLRSRQRLTVTACPKQRRTSEFSGWCNRPAGEARLLTADCPLDQAEPYGDPGHYETWAHWRGDRTLDPALRALVRAYEYEDWPRGRIVFDRLRDLFILYADRARRRVRGGRAKPASEVTTDPRNWSNSRRAKLAAPLPKRS
jgi:hypothetical protein